jgi:maltose alpha-D-glucosyltransferase/alpha-amylase
VKKLASTSNPLWYKDAIIYELHVRAFSDSNGDGIGDFHGLLSRLDYLQDLGVTCIWLLPFFPSPLRDDGYDIANYVDVNPSYGTLDDFRQFLDAAHLRNMQVMIELVINHTSDQHPWFKAARLAPPGSPAREMYVWSSTDQKYKDARIIFTDTEKCNWTWDETAQAYYWHRFFSHQPDLNFDNPAVLEEILKAMRFWLDMGVDALRMDAIPYLVERDSTSCENLPETHSIIKAIRAAIDADYSNRLVLAEANQWPADVRPYFGDGDECHMAFHFPLMPRIYMALRQEDRLPITDIMAQTPAIPASCQWGLFLRNHDELTLEMVTDDERDYMYFAYSADPRMRINVGIRRRLAPLVDNNRRRIELLNSLLLSFPGTPILYYGDELGMGDNIYLGDRNGVRTPMQWTSDRNAGFSRCDPARLYFPVVMDPIYGYQVVNVEAQLSDPSSLLHWTRNMIALRKLFQVFGRGTLRFLNPENRTILAYIRELSRTDSEEDDSADSPREIVLCVANLSRSAQPVSLDLSDFRGLVPVEMLGYVPFPTITEAPYPLTLSPYSFLWLELQPAGSRAQLLPDPEAIEGNFENQAFAHPDFDLSQQGWSSLVSEPGSRLLEKALRDWLPKRRWFGAKTRSFQSIRILAWAEIPGSSSTSSSASAPAGASAQGAIPAALFFVEIAYASGVSDVYQLPLTIASGAEAESLAQSFPEIVIATVPSGGASVLLYDATASELFQQSLLPIIERNATLPLTTATAVAKTEAPAPATVALPANHLDLPAELPPDRSDSSAGSQVGPVRLTAQPGEAATSPRSDNPAAPQAQQRRSRESPSAGDPIPMSGRLDARASTAYPQAHSPHRQLSRLSLVEQSNTSIIFGNQLILKLFRRLQPGEHPDVEIGRFLTEAARFPRIPTLLGEITITPASGEKTTVAMLQKLVANQGDGWKWFLDQLAAQLASFYTATANLAGSPGLDQHSISSFLSNSPPHPGILQHASVSLQAAALLGKRTAEMHLALATPTENPAFAAEPMTAADLDNDAGRVQTQISSTLEALKTKLPNLSDHMVDDAALLLSRRSRLFSLASVLSTSPAAGQRIRIHGDYHLGQTLRTESSDGNSEPEGDFCLLDFEGEPARSLEERRQKQSPLKDVAGMIRSFSYAAHSALNKFLENLPEDNRRLAAQALSAWATAWQNSASSEFLRSYRETISANSALLPPPEQSQSLLTVYLLEKALYELLYELNNRPNWLPIPLAGILAL